MIKNLKIGTFNVNSAVVRSKHLLEILEAHEPDLLFLQECFVLLNLFFELLRANLLNKRYA